ncbi:MAG: DNA repair protein RecO [Moraxellaceae bacterium]|nr:DNA repair protein RecO [Moraxellaceae bacterium]
MPGLMHAYLLHARPYRETSRLIDVFTAEQGRLGAIWRGARRGGGTQPQLFQPLLIDLHGNGELRTVRQIEPAGAALQLTGTPLFSGFYLNELLSRLLPREEVQIGLFSVYAEALGLLAEGKMIEPLLRRFEHDLLEVLGFGIDFGCEGTGEPIQPDFSYAFFVERGFLRVTSIERGWPGELLLRIADGVSLDEDVLRALKSIHRLAISSLLGGRPLKSRELFQTVR